MEEFHESEILWPDQQNHNSNSNSKSKSSHSNHMHFNSQNSSSPISIPMSSSFDSSRHNNEWCNEEDNPDKVPPHVVVSRRNNVGKMAFSLCSGQGRTLKGRDLSHVRNSVLRMTGFLEG
ncbi:hypothetical protein LUZ60_000495 [Juncus effusus]|nr:hypothetical protein LUZ60_000495 [Juncus effusus]